MSRGPYKMPTVQQFLSNKIIYDKPKKEPVWVYLEKEMRANVDKKPYNEVVGEWLQFLKDLKYHYYCEAKRKEKRLRKEVGPSWYVEFSSDQREVLKQLKANIHQDLIEDLPTRIRKSLSDLGLTLRIKRPILMKAMNECVEDPGVFIWNLYTALYKLPPCQPRGRYDMNAMILMSALVFIDLDECVQKLEELTYTEKVPSIPPKDYRKKNTQPHCRYGEYLQKCYVPLYTRQKPRQAKLPRPLEYKFKLRSDQSLERIQKDLAFLEKRKYRNKKEQQIERICTYKFWEPPSTFRNTDPRMAQYVDKLKMIKKKAKLKFITSINNLQPQIGGVSYINGTPQYLYFNVCVLPTGYVTIHGGFVKVGNENVLTIQGQWMFPKHEEKHCDKTCDCLTKWEPTIMDFLKESKCTCGHLYDYYNEGKVVEKYFYQPHRHGSYWMDSAKIYQMDPMEDFINDEFRAAMMSNTPTPQPSNPAVSASGKSEKELLRAFLADISDTPIIIPHLPQAYLLNNLLEWVRNRVKGKLTPNKQKRFTLQSLRRWLDLKHMDFRARAYRIPFTLQQLEHMNWSHRNLVQKLFETLLNNFVSRNQLAQLQQTRLWWPTTKYDTYPSKAFLDIFFTYMPARMKDTCLVNPYSSENTPKHGGKTCPLAN